MRAMKGVIGNFLSFSVVNIKALSNAGSLVKLEKTRNLILLLDVIEEV